MHAMLRIEAEAVDAAEPLLFTSVFGCFRSLLEPFSASKRLKDHGLRRENSMISRISGDSLGVS